MFLTAIMLLTGELGRIRTDLGARRGGLSETTCSHTRRCAQEVARTERMQTSAPGHEAGVPVNAFSICKRLQQLGR